jgi:hypothetical protein
MVTVCEWFGLKTTRMVFVGLASKPVVTVSSGLASKPAVTVFSSLTSKLVVTVSSAMASKSVSWLRLKTQVVEGFLVWASKLDALVW